VIYASHAVVYFCHAHEYLRSACFTIQVNAHSVSIGSLALQYFVENSYLLNQLRLIIAFGSFKSKLAQSLLFFNEFLFSPLDPS
jgi:hypothetical protein